MSYKISNESPVGKALIGKREGETVEVAVPGGMSKFQILEIRRD
jgi:transcription elongation factor GreA